MTMTTTMAWRIKPIAKQRCALASLAFAAGCKRLGKLYCGDAVILLAAQPGARVVPIMVRGRRRG